MADEDRNRSGDGPQERGEDDFRDVRLPEAPSLPTLPAAPILKPNLPKLAKPSQAAEDYRQMGIAYIIPAMLVAPILLLTLLGYWLDNHFHKTPAFTIGGMLLGAITGLINMVRTAGKLNK